MKKITCSAILLLSFLFIIGQNRMYPEGIDTPNTKYFKEISKQPEFISVYQKTLELNQERFSDLNLIQVGDTIYFPKFNENGIKKIVAKKPDVNNFHDFIWTISKSEYTKYLESKDIYEANLFKQKVLASINNFSNSSSNKEDNDNNIIKNTNTDIWWIFIVLFFITFLLVYINVILKTFINKITKKTLKGKHIVLDNINLLSAEEKISYFKKYINPKEKIKSIETGTLKRHFGKKYLKVKVQGKIKTYYIYLREGEFLTRVVIKKKDFTKNCYCLYFKNQGGNLFLKRKDRMIIPANWYFDPDFKENKPNQQNESLAIIDIISEIDDKRDNLVRKINRKKKKKKNKFEKFKELDKVIETLRSYKYLRYKIKYQDNFGDWKLKLKIKALKKKS